MAKSTDFPPQIREFGMAISKFSHRHYDYTIFEDFIDYVICCLLWEGHPETVERLKRKYEDEYQKFFELYRSFMLCQKKNLSADDSYDWYDTLGTIYEAISSSSKASRLGQFFTPKSLCDMMAHFTSPVQGEKKTGLKVNDCACGSGRTLLAFNKIAPGNRLYGEDLDQICTKMATINLAIHGCKGQVSNMDSLRMEWYFGYEINPWQNMTNGFPHIVPITKEQSHTYQQWEYQKLESTVQKIDKISDKAKKETVQLTLF